MTKNITHNIDCMEFLKTIPNKFYDLAIVDPPYGINAPNMRMGTNPNRKDSKGGISVAEKLRLNSGAGKLKNRVLNTMPINWDYSTPSPEYFSELFRVSKNQIIWGGNYFNLPPTSCFVVWDKIQSWENFSQAELAWTSFDKPSKVFRFSNRGGNNAEEKIHPTQKPVELYKFLYKHFSKKGIKVIDTHLGGGSNRIAADVAGVDFTGLEIDKNYFDAQQQRYLNYKIQQEIHFSYD